MQTPNTEPLSGKQKRVLRSIGQGMGDMAVVGREGPSDASLRHLGELLARHELIKVRLVDEYGSDRKAAAGELAEATHAQVAGVVGRTVLLYKANPELPKDKRVALPA